MAANRRTPLTLVVTIVTCILFQTARADAADLVRACQETVAKAGAVLVDKVIRVEQACLRKVARGRLPAGTRCVGSGGDLSAITSVPVRAALQRAVDAARAAMQAKCGAVDLLATRPDGLGMPPACPAIHPSCAGTLFDLTDAIACQVCTHVSAVHYLLGVQYPGADATPDPNATPTPTVTPHPQSTTNVVSFEIGATTQIQAFQFHVLYPGDKGSFRGAATDVACVADSTLGFFIRNHQQNQDNLITLIASGGNLGLPTTIACTFDSAKNKELTTADLTVVVDDVTVDNASADPNVLSIGKSIVDRTTPCLGGTAVVAVTVDAAFADLAITVGYPPNLVGLPASGASDARVGIGPFFGSSSAEDVDVDQNGTDDAVRVTYASSHLEEAGVFAEIHFDCVGPLSADDLASFTCAVDEASDGSGASVDASCSVTRIGFPTALP